MLREQLKDWRVWLMMTAVAMSITATLRVSFDVFSASAKHERETAEALATLDDRLLRLELSKTPATMKRYTSDHFLKLAECLKIPYATRQPCIDALTAEFKRTTP